ncbi:MAG: adenylate/guanylate cyclase domain-containing protein [Candidatus Pacearchaeota archaeon]
MKKFFYWFSCLILLSFFFSCAKPSTKVPPVASGGVLDLQDWDFKVDGIVKLDGEWEFYWNQLIQSEKDSEHKKQFVQVPSVWNDTVEGVNSRKAFGYASYKLNIKMNPNQKEAIYLHMQDFGTAGVVYVNGHKLLQNGHLGKTAETSIPQYLPVYARVPEHLENLEVVVEISNFHHHKGGLWESLRIGSENAIVGFSKQRGYTDFFILGSILIMGIYHFGIYYLRRKDPSAFYFGLFCISISLRTSTTGERILFQYYPNINWEFGNKLEYFSLYLAVPLFYQFLRSIFPLEFPKILAQISFWFHIVLFVVVIFTPALIYTQTLIPFELFFIGISLTIIIFFGKAIYYRREGAIPSATGTLALVLAGVNDVLHSQLIINTGYITPIGLFIFIFFQGYMLAARFSKAFKDVEDLSENLKNTNLAYSKFVPMAFLNLLERKSITSIMLGDQMQKDMSVMFVDIRGFTKLSSTMSPKDNFDFINSYLKNIGPVIRKNNGFIDKYIGDAIMALFPDSLEDAIQTSLEIHHTLVQVNQKRTKKGYSPIEVGIGINVGNLMLGIIGESERMESTVISDVVNVASRVEGLCKIFHASILITEFAYLRLKNKNLFPIRYVGKALVKGKDEELKVYEVIDPTNEEIAQKKILTKEIFESAVNYFEHYKFEEAKINFQKVLELNPNDKTAQYYLSLTER